MVCVSARNSKREPDGIRIIDSKRTVNVTSALNNINRSLARHDPQGPVPPRGRGIGDEYTAHSLKYEQPNAHVNLTRTLIT